MARSTAAAAVGAAAAWTVTAELTTVWGGDPGLVLAFVRLCAATSVGGLVILVGSLALRIDEPRALAAIVLDLLHRIPNR